MSSAAGLLAQFGAPGAGGAYAADASGAALPAGMGGFNLGAATCVVNDPELQVALKQVLKKDDRTKLQGFAALERLIESKEKQVLDECFQQFPLARLYLDGSNEPRVRLGLAKVLGAFVSKLGKSSLFVLRERNGASIVLLQLFDRSPLG
jgi:hypothetical protein